MNAVATSIVLLLAAILIGAMIFMLRIMIDDSGKHSELRSFVEGLFRTSTPLNSENESSDPLLTTTKDIKSSSAANSAESFSELCPACEEAITHEHEECPSCGLRLL